MLFQIATRCFKNFTTFETLSVFTTGESPLLDSYAIKHVNDDEPSGTFNGFKGTADGARIDWIAVSRNISIESANIDRIAFDGRYPSDHFPVNAVLRLK